MRKISLKIILSLFTFCSLTAQENNNYKKQKVSIQDVSILSSFYSQDGNNSAVTGGAGTERLEDFSNQLQVKFAFDNLKKPNLKHTLNLKVGIDYYTSASSDNIDFIPTSASTTDDRFYPSLDYSFENTEKNLVLGGGLYYSKEFDYTSLGGKINMSTKWNDKNTEYSTQFSMYSDKLLKILPWELRDASIGYYKYDTENRNTIAISQSLTQVLSKKSIIGLNSDVVIQSGYLSTPFNRVIFSNNELTNEKLQDYRLKLPIGIRYNTYLSEKVKLRSFYRFYWDNWGIKSNTLELEAPIKISNKLTVSPYFRLYNQSSADAFGTYGTIDPSSQYYTSDYDLSEFTSIMPGVTLQLESNKGLLFENFKKIFLKYSYYSRSNNLTAHSVTLYMNFN